jgi:hypothetical protein
MTQLSARLAAVEKLAATRLCPACVATSKNPVSLDDVRKKFTQMRAEQLMEYRRTASTDQLLERAERLESEAAKWRELASSRRIRGKAVDVIDRQFDSADVDAAPSVLRTISAPTSGLTDPDAIIDTAARFTRMPQLPEPPMTDADRMAELYGTSERETDDERAERTTAERMAAAAGITDDGEAQ